MHRGFLVVGAWIVFAAPAYADTTTAVSFADPCGDNNAFVEVNGTRHDLPSTADAPQFDIKRVTVDRIADGVSVLIESCAPIGDSTGLRGERLLTAPLPGGCYLAIEAIDGLAPGQARSAQVAKDCDSVPPPLVDDPNIGTIPDPRGNQDDNRFTIKLPASSVTTVGGSLLVTVHRADLGNAEALAAFAPGTQWQWLSAASAQDLETTVGFGGTDATPGFRWAAPTGIDFAQTTASFTL